VYEGVEGQLEVDMMGGERESGGLVWSFDSASVVQVEVRE